MWLLVWTLRLHTRHLSPFTAMNVRHSTLIHRENDFPPRTLISLSAAGRVSGSRWASRINVSIGAKTNLRPVRKQARLFGCACPQHTRCILVSSGQTGRQAGMARSGPPILFLCSTGLQTCRLLYPSSAALPPFVAAFPPFHRPASPYLACFSRAHIADQPQLKSPLVWL